MFHFKMGILKSLFSAPWQVVGLYVDFHVLQIEDSLMRVER